MIQIVLKIFIDPNNIALLFLILKSSYSQSDTISFYSSLEMFAGFLINEPYLHGISNYCRNRINSDSTSKSLTLKSGVLHSLKQKVDIGPRVAVRSIFYVTSKISSTAYYCLPNSQTSTREFLYRLLRGLLTSVAALYSRVPGFIPVRGLDFRTTNSLYLFVNEA